MEQNSSTQIKRRKALKIVGSSSIGAVSPISQISDADDTVRIPLYKSGNCIRKWKEVPSDWYNQKQHAVKVLNRNRDWLHSIDGVRGTGLSSSEQQYGGLAGKQIAVEVREKEIKKKIPEQISGVSVEVFISPPPSAGGYDRCYDGQVFNYIPGGVSFESRYDGDGDGVEDEMKFGTTCAPVTVDGYDRLLTAAHLYRVCDGSDIASNAGYQGGEQMGGVTDWNASEDWVLLSYSSSKSPSNYIWTDQYSVQLEGHVTSDGVDYLDCADITLYQQGCLTGITDGPIMYSHYQVEGITSSVDCVDVHGVRLNANGGEGDSGGPIFHNPSGGPAWLVGMFCIYWYDCGSGCDGDNQVGCEIGGPSAHYLHDNYGWSFGEGFKYNGNSC